MAQPRKRKVLTLGDRLKVIQAVENNPSKTRPQLAEEFGVPLPTLTNLLKSKDKYLAHAKSGEVTTTSKQARTSQMGSVDQDLLRWFTSCRLGISYS